MTNRIISLTFDEHPEWYIKSGKYFRSNQKANTFYIQDDLNYEPDYTSMKYNNEKYLYVFLFYDFSENSLLRRIFLQLLTTETASFYEKNQCAVLSDKKLDFYDYEEENVIYEGVEYYDNDLGGALTSAIINN